MARRTSGSDSRPERIGRVDHSRETAGLATRLVSGKSPFDRDVQLAPSEDVRFLVETATRDIESTDAGVPDGYGSNDSEFEFFY